VIARPSLSFDHPIVLPEAQFPVGLGRTRMNWTLFHEVLVEDAREFLGILLEVRSRRGDISVGVTVF